MICNSGTIGCLSTAAVLKSVRHAKLATAPRYTPFFAVGNYCTQKKCCTAHLKWAIDNQYCRSFYL